MAINTTGSYYHGDERPGLHLTDYRQDGLILAEDFNFLRGEVLEVLSDHNQNDITVIRGGFGYGIQNITIPTVNASDIVRAAEWQSLKSAIGYILYHQNPSQIADFNNLITVFESNNQSPDLKTFVGAEILSYNDRVNGLIGTIETIRENRFKTHALVLRKLFTTDVRLDNWTNSIKSKIKFDFASFNDMRYYFNTGGKVALEFVEMAINGLSPSDVNYWADPYYSNAWHALIAQIGTLEISADAITRTGSNLGGTFNNLPGFYGIMESTNGVGQPVDVLTLGTSLGNGTTADHTINITVTISGLAIYVEIEFVAEQPLGDIDIFEDMIEIEYSHTYSISNKIPSPVPNVCIYPSISGNALPCDGTAPINYGPVITSNPIAPGDVRVQVNEGQLYEYILTVTDADNDPLSVLVNVGTTDWLSVQQLTPTTFRIYGMPVLEALHYVSVDIVVTDPTGAFAVQQYVIDVREPLAPTPTVNALIFDSAADASTYTTTYTPPTQLDVFNSWDRFGGGAHFDGGTTISDPAANAFAYDVGLDAIRTTENLSSFAGFLNPAGSETLSLGVTLSGDVANSDDDILGAVIGYNKVSATQTHALMAIRTCGGLGAFGSSHWPNSSGADPYDPSITSVSDYRINWYIVLMEMGTSTGTAGNTVLKAWFPSEISAHASANQYGSWRATSSLIGNITAPGITPMPVPATYAGQLRETWYQSPWGYAGYTRLKIERDQTSITAYSTPFTGWDNATGSSVFNPLTTTPEQNAMSKIEIDVENEPLLAWMTTNPTQYGYVCFSQSGGLFSDIEVTGPENPNLIYIVDTNEVLEYDANSNMWVTSATHTIVGDLGTNVLVVNASTTYEYIIDGSGNIVKQ